MISHQDWGYAPPMASGTMLARSKRFDISDKSQAFSPPLCHSYHLQTTRDMRPHTSVTLDPSSFHPPPFRSRNQSYMRAVSTLSQASCVSQVSPVSRPDRAHRGNPPPTIRGPGRG